MKRCCCAAAPSDSAGAAAAPAASTESATSTTPRATYLGRRAVMRELRRFRGDPGAAAMQTLLGFVLGQCSSAPTLESTSGKNRLAVLGCRSGVRATRTRDTGWPYRAGSRACVLLGNAPRPHRRRRARLLAHAGRRARHPLRARTPPVGARPARRDAVRRPGPACGHDRSTCGAAARPRFPMRWRPSTSGSRSRGGTGSSAGPTHGSHIGLRAHPRRRSRRAPVRRMRPASGANGFATCSPGPREPRCSASASWSSATSTARRRWPAWRRSGR